MISATDMRVISPQFRELTGYRAIVRKLTRKIELARKYGNVPQAEIIRAQKFIAYLQPLIIQLDNNKTIQHQPEKRALLNGPRADLYKALMPSSPDGKLTQYTKAQRGALDAMSSKAYLANVQRYKFELHLEVAAAAATGKYMVFNTLTARNDTMSKVFSTGDNSFSMYIRRFTTLDPTHKYFGVMEFGGKGGRPHLHVLHILSKMPWNDPNGAYPIRPLRQIEHIRGFWGHGFSTPIAVRYFNDAYSKLGWYWPTEQTGEPIKASQPGATASYITKYVSKSYEEERKEFPWRIRKSRKFGTNLISPILNKMTDNQLIAATLHSDKIKIGHLNLPLSLLHRQAMTSLLNRWNLDGSLGRLITEWQSQVTLFMRLRNSTPMTQESNLQNIMSFMTRNSLVTEPFNLKQEGRAVRALLQEELDPLFAINERETKRGHTTGTGKNRHS